MSGFEAWPTSAASVADVDGDSETNVAENNSPRTVNNALRAAIANVRLFLNLVGGAVDSGGTADAQTVTTGLSWSLANQQDELIGFRAGAGLTNTGAMTLAVDGAAATAVKMPDGNDPPAGAVTAGGVYFVVYDGTVYRLINSAVAPGLSSYLPLAGGTMSGELSLADQLLTRPKIKDYGESLNAIGSIGGGTQDIDLTLGNVVSGTVDTSETTFTFSNPPASGVNGGFKLYLTNGGSQTVNWPASVDWAGGTAPTLTASGLDVLVFETNDGGTTWFGFAAGLDMQ